MTDRQSPAPECSVSVVLPTYNEAGNIVPLINGIREAMPSGWTYEIIIMDDGSSDGTLETVKKAFPSDVNIRAVRRTNDRGLGQSIRDGIATASLERIIVMDSDLTHDPAEIPGLLHVGSIYDIVSASRFCAGGRMTNTSHYVISMLYNWALRLLLRTQIQDNLGGYFTARRSTLLKLPVDDIFYGYGDYYFRLLHFAQHAGMSIVEIPAWYLARGEGKSKSSWPHMISAYTAAALRLRLRMWRTMRGVQSQWDLPPKERRNPSASR